MTVIFRNLSALLLLSMPLFAAAAGLYGFELGTALKLPDCKKDRLGHYKSREPTQSPCSQHEGKVGSVEPRYIEYKIRFPENKGPLYAKDGALTVHIYNGVIQKISFFTGGKPVFEKVKAGLTEKFGEPTRDSKVEGTLTMPGPQRGRRSNTFSTRNILQTAWEAETYNLVLTELDRYTDQGLVTLSSSQSKEIDQKRLDALSESIRNKGPAL